jgi:membrane protein YqaA with SNARE-associated domain
MTESTTDAPSRADRFAPFRWMRATQAWVEGLADKSYAVPALFALAAAESIFFPIPVDVLLIALCVGKPRVSLRFAAICTVGSVLGGAIGYSIGYWLWYDLGAGPEVFSSIARFFFDHVPGFNLDVFRRVQGLYQEYDFLAVFAAGFTPLPYKVFTITAGVFKVSFPVFVLASVASRAGRFFLVAGLFFFFGMPIKRFIDKYLELLSVAFLLLLVGGFVLLKYVF